MSPTTERTRMEDVYDVPQRQAAGMLRGCGLSRRAAYYHLAKLPSQHTLGVNVYSRIDVESVCDAVKEKQRSPRQ